MRCNGKKAFLRTSLRYDDLRLGADTVIEDQTYQVLKPQHRLKL